MQAVTRSHGGLLTVTSTEGTGSTFRVFLPAQAVETAPPPVEEELTHPSSGHGEVILIVDDDASVLAIAQQTLEAFGYIPITAEDGARAIGIFARRHAEIGAVVTDMVMPVMDGIALIAGLKNIDPAVRIVATTGSAGYDAALIRAGASQVLNKPFTAETLLRAVAGALASRPEP